MEEPSLDSEALAERLEDERHLMQGDGLAALAQTARQAASLIRSQAEALKVAREGLSEIAGQPTLIRAITDATMRRDEHEVLSAYHVRHIVSETLAEIGARSPNHSENTSTFPHSEIQE